MVFGTIFVEILETDNLSRVCQIFSALEIQLPSGTFKLGQLTWNVTKKGFRQIILAAVKM